MASFSNNKHVFYLTFLCLSVNILTAQLSIKQPFQSNVFIPDSGQFKSFSGISYQLLFGATDEKIFFDKCAVYFAFTQRIFKPTDEQNDPDVGKVKIKHHNIILSFENAKTQSVLPISPTSSYYTFGEKNYEHIKFTGYHQLKYVQLYPGIDAFFYLPSADSNGLYYQFKVYPAANYSQIVMKWKNINHLKTEGHTLIAETPAGEIKSYSLKAYYQSDHSYVDIKWKILSSDKVCFEMHNTRDNDTIIIDPWIVTPNTLTNNQRAYDVDYDKYGNAYIFGGSYPYKLAKYDITGTLLWTYTIPAGFSASYSMYSEHMVLRTWGAVYIGEGLYSASPNPRVLKIGTNGIQLFMNTVNNSNNEIWSLVYNQCSGKMLGFGGGNVAAMYNAYILNDTNITNVTMANTNGITNVASNDIADAVLDNNGDFYALIGSYGHPQNGNIFKSSAASNYLPPTIFNVSSGYNMDEICSMSIFPMSVCHGANQSNRMNALSLNNSYLFSYDGKTLKAWDKTNGNLLAQIVVNTVYADGKNRTHEGIAADECNRVYVGGYQAVHTYSFNGSAFISLGNITGNIPNEVYDIMLNEASATLYISGNGFLSTHSIASCNSLSLSVTSVSTCGNNGSATVTVAGGTAPYSYQWSTGATTSVVANLSPGTYTVYVQDASCIGRFASTTVTITSSGSSFNFTSVVQNALCYGAPTGAATVNVSGGTAPYSYTWSQSGGNSNIAINLSAGNYTLTVTDAAGCSGSYTLAVTQPPDMNVQATITNSISCYGGTNGSASVSVSGGTAPYSYTWLPSGGNASGASALTAGNYTVVVKDNNLCSKSVTLNIPQASSVSILTNTPYACYGSSAVVNATVSGGSGNYSYTWQPSGSGNNSYTVSNVTSDIQFTLSVSDNGCPPVTTLVNLTAGPPLTATGMMVSVCDKATVNIFPQITSPGNGGTYSYLWLNNGSTSSVLTVVGDVSNPIQTFTVQISDGCTIPDAIAVCTVQVLPYSIPTLSISAIPLNGCEPLQVNYTATSNDSMAVFSWNFGNGITSSQNPVSVNYTASGVYSPTVVVVSQYGCIKDTVLNNYINVYPVPQASFECIPSATANLVDATITFSNHSFGANQYSWNFGDPCSLDNYSNEQNPIHEYNCSGTYTVLLIATNEYGCVDTSMQIIWIKPEIHIYIPNCFTPDGDGLNDMFLPKGMGFLENDYKMLIFDRWGEQIFESNEFHRGWDGRVKDSSVIAAEGVYVYKIYAKDIKGRAYEFVGHVTCLPFKEK